MSWGYVAMGAATLISGYLQKRSSDKAAEKAAQAQVAGAQAGVSEQRQQFEDVQRLLAPYVQSGTSAIGGQEALLGLSGPEEQQKAIAAIQDSPQFGAITQQGENAILQNASATGGLRGGNVQASLAQFRPQVLSQLIEKQYGRLGQLSTLGQASAAGQAAQAQRLGETISGQYGQIGSAQAGQALAQGANNVRWTGTVGNVVGQGIGAYAQGKF